MGISRLWNSNNRNIFKLKKKKTILLTGLIIYTGLTRVLVSFLFDGITLFVL